MPAIKHLPQTTLKCPEIIVAPYRSVSARRQCRTTALLALEAGREGSGRTDLQSSRTARAVVSQRNLSRKTTTSKLSSDLISSLSKG